MEPKLEGAVPILASLDIEQTVEFYRSRLGFETMHAEPNEYAIVKRDAVELHFWKCDDKRIPQLTACRVAVQGIETLYKELQASTSIHPNAPLEHKPWGTSEFAIIDGDGNCLTFFERGAGS